MQKVFLWMAKSDTLTLRLSFVSRSFLLRPGKVNVCYFRLSNCRLLSEEDAHTSWPLRL